MVPAWPPAPGRDQDQAVDARLGRLLGVAEGGDVVEDEAAVVVDGVHQVAHRAERGDDQRHLVCLTAELQIRHHPRIGVVHDQVDAKARAAAAERAPLISTSQASNSPRSCAG